MPESRQSYFLSNLSLDEINRILQLITDRLDEMEGLRGDPTISGSVNIESTLQYQDEQNTVLHGWNP